MLTEKKMLYIDVGFFTLHAMAILYMTSCHYQNNHRT
jgi:hypothetical protein